MARYRLSEPARADIAVLLRTSETMHGAEARIRYRALLTAALRRVAADPQGRPTGGSVITDVRGVTTYIYRYCRREKDR